MMSQLATAIAALHEQGICCDSLSPETIWVHKSGFTQFRLELPHKTTRLSAAEKTSDWMLFGAIFFRVIYGKPLAGSSDTSAAEAVQISSAGTLQQELAKYELPPKLLQLLTALLYPKTNSQRLDSISSVLSALASKPLNNVPIPAEPSLAAFRRALTMFVQPRGAALTDFPKLEISQIESKPLENWNVTIPPIKSSAKDHASRKVPQSKRNKRWLSTALTLASIWICCGLLGLGAYLAANREGPGRTMARLPDQPDQEILQTTSADTGRSETARSNAGQASIESSLGSTHNGLDGPTDSTPIVIQTLVDDDRTRLWQSPTQGAAFDLDGLPPSPKIVFAIRPAELIASSGGELLLKSFGPDFQRLIQQWENLSGTPLTEIEQLVVSLHSNEEFKYEPYVRCLLKKPVDASSLIQRFKNLRPESTEENQIYYATQDLALGFVVLHTNQGAKTVIKTGAVADEENSAKGAISQFGVGGLRLIKQVADSPIASGNSTIRSLANRTDRQRHVNLLVLRPALFNDEGQALMAGKWSTLNRALSDTLPDEILGASLSLHLDEGTFVELQFAQTADLRAVEMQHRLETGFRQLRDRANGFIPTIPTSPYWDRVRLKLGLMSVDAFRSMRWGVEQGEVVANSWLPPMAAHNLIAAMELGVSFAGGTTPALASTAAVDSSSGTPQSLDELLASKRDLKVANPPDLNLLMSDLEQEIIEDFPRLPFQFRIRLLGPDLQVEGITQNQRPGELNIQQLSLAEILTKIMVSANPTKEISGPADPRCKLVWAIADDPDKTGQKIIVITTRNAAQRKKYQLPSAFQME